MTLLELLNKIIEDKQAGALFREIYANYYLTCSITPTNYEKVKKAIGIEIDCLMHMDSIYGPSKYEIRVVKMLMHNDNVENYGFDVFLIEPNREQTCERYGVEFMDWEEVANSPVNPKSVLRYGIIPCVAAILYNLSFFGFDYTDATKRRDETMKEITQELDALENVSDYSKYHTMDDLYEELNVEKPSKNDQAKWEQQWKEEKEFYSSEYSKLFEESHIGVPGDAQIPENEKATE